MATTDFRFRVSKAVGSPAVQGAASVETLANHTSNPQPHPQYMRKSAVEQSKNLTEHLQSRTDHARNHALRDELMTSKLEYEKYKNISLSRDASNYLAPSGIKAHVITAFVLNQILQDVGLDGSVKALTYNNLVNSYDTKVADEKLYAPTWEIFLKLKNSIAPWLTYNNPNDFLLKRKFYDWVKYMYTYVEPNDETHPLRPGLKVALYATDYVPTEFTPLPSGTSPGGTDRGSLSNKNFIPSLSDTSFKDAVFYTKVTSDTEPDPNKVYYYVVDKIVYLFTGEEFEAGVTYYEKVYADLKKVQGPCLTVGCSILDTTCTIDQPGYFDWSNGLYWDFYSGDPDHPTIDPYSPRIMVWEGRIKLNAGQRIIFAGVVDDAVLLQIGNTVLTRTDENNCWQWYGDTLREKSYDSETLPKYEFTATNAGLYTFRMAIYSMMTVGPKPAPQADVFSTNIPFRMSLDGGETFLTISNESVSEPIFFLKEGCEKEITYTEEVRDRNNYRPDPKPGLLVRMWKSPAVSQDETIDPNLWTHPARCDDALKLLEWKSSNFYGDMNPQGNTRTWTSFIGPYITNGCSMLKKCCTQDDPSFFDWYNGQTWTYWAGSAANSRTYPWATRTAGWFGMIYLKEGETVKFSGYVEDLHWIKIDDTWVVNGQSCSDVTEPPVHTFVATYTGYHPFKLLTRNQTWVGPKMQTNDYYLKMAINDDNFVDISNESFVTPRFFLPEDCDQEAFWDQGVALRDRYAILEMSDKIEEYEQRFIRALSTVNHVPDWNTRAACTGVLDTTAKTLTWTVPNGISHGTINLMFAAESSNGTDSSSQSQPGVLSVKMPGLDASWVEVTYLATFHSTTKYSGEGTNSFGRYECNMTFRVISGMQFKLSRVASVLHDHSCTIEDYQPEPST